MRLVCALAVLVLVAGCAHPAPSKTIAVTMRRYKIEPEVIHLKRGEPVRFVVTTADVQHGFTVPDLGIREPVNPGHPAVFDFTPRTAGSFEVKCGILCGPGHDTMKATLVVE